MFIMQKIIIYLNTSLRYLKNGLFYLAIILVLCAPVLLYVWHFKNYDISDNPADWGNFGDYIGGVYSVLVALTVCILSYKIDARGKRKDKARECAAEIYKQIVTIKSNKYNLRSSGKLLALVSNANLFLPQRVCDEIEALANNYMSFKNDGAIINETLENNTLKDLKKII